MKNSFSILLLFLFLPIFGQGKYQIDLNQENTPLKFTTSKSLSLIIESQFSHIDFFDVNSKKGSFAEVSIPGTYSSHAIGSPKLPQVKKLIDIPQDAKTVVNILDFDVIEYNLSEYGILNQIIPAQPSLSKNDDPATIEFIYNKEVYERDAFTETPLAEVQYVGQMRGTRLGRIVISPVQYNPVTNKIRVYKNLKISIEFKGANLTKTSQLKKATYSPIFNNALQSIPNSNILSVKDEITKYPVKYVIISDRMFESTLAPFISWKTKKGFEVITAYTDEIGSTKSAIKNHLKGLYDAGTSSDPAPTYVLFVGDVAQIPAYDTELSGDYHVTDLYYCEYTGDRIPEMYYGRFSASNIDELRPQIDKTLEYEQYTMPDPSFLNDVVLVAGADANYAPTHGNGQINYGTANYFNSAHGINAHTYLYPASESSSSQIRSDISDGCGFANYTAHCGPDGWSSPSFSISHISSLENNHEYPLMIGNCCRSSRYNENCFAEEILRAENKGAIGYIGGSDYTYWDEDFYFGVGVGTISANPTYSGTNLGAYDCVFHENGEAVNKWFVTNGQVIMAGNLAVTEDGGSLVDYYWEIYCLMGDPSVMNYFTQPDPLTIDYPSSILINSTSLTINTEVHAYVAISKGGILLDAKYSDNSTNVTLTFDAISQPGNADIVITKQNRAPYIGSIKITGDIQPPVANFSANPTTIFEGESVQFTDESQNSPTSYEWTFEKGTPSSSTEKNPVIKYEASGIYQVSLTVSNNEGSDTETKNGYITVNKTQAPVVDFTASKTAITIGESVTFTDNSTNTPTSWNWIFEGGTPKNSNEQNPTVTYNTAGTYNVTLEASNNSGSNSTQKEDYITVIANYCESQGNNSNYEWISEVQIGDYINSSGSASYTDFTSETITISTGQTNVKLTPEFSYRTYSEYWKIWIDLNTDGDFDDANELVFDSGSLSRTTVSGELNIPESAIGVNSRMRVSMKYNDEQTSCERFSYGEVEDYTVKITEPKIVTDIKNNNSSSIDFNIYPNPVNEKLYINIPNIQDKLFVEIYNIAGQIIKNKLVNTQENFVDVSDLRGGVYLVKVSGTQNKIIYKIIKQ